MAGLHVGAIQCEDNYIDDYNSIDLDNMVPRFIDEGEEEICMYYEHPKYFVPNNVIEWFEEFKYYKDFNGAPSFNECNLKFLEAKTCYESWLSYWNTPKVNNEGFS